MPLFERYTIDGNNKYFRTSGDLSCVKIIVEEKDGDTEKVPDGIISPKMTPVHMCALFNRTDIVTCVVSPSNVNVQDQVREVMFYVVVAIFDF